MKTTIKIFLGLALISQVLFGQQLVNDKLTLSKKGMQDLIISEKIQNKNVTPAPLKQKSLTAGLNNTADFSAVFENTQKKKKKSVALGVLFSALIPGTGELYGENYLKAAIFFGVELLAWGTYFYFEGKGDKKTDEYYAYADTYWDIRTYARWLKDNNFEENTQINPDEPNRSVLEEQIRICERANFSHTLPEYKSQQYYELIGKYQNFQAGWTNLQHAPTTDPQSPYYYQTYRDPIFTAYAQEREEANDFYEYAKIGPVTAIINHVLSALDAAWVVSTYNSKIKVETGFRMNNIRSPYTYKIEHVPTFNMSVSF